MAQNDPVIPTRSAARAGRIAISIPAARQANEPSASQHTASRGSRCALIYLAMAAGTAAIDSTSSRVLASFNASERNRATGSQFTAGRAFCGCAAM
jgi:hypothetical protein